VRCLSGAYTSCERMLFTMKQPVAAEMAAGMERRIAIVKSAVGCHGRLGTERQEPIEGGTRTTPGIRFCLNAGDEIELE